MAKSKKKSKPARPTVTMTGKTPDEVANWCINGTEKTCFLELGEETIQFDSPGDRMRFGFGVEWAMSQLKRADIAEFLVAKLNSGIGDAFNRQLAAEEASGTWKELSPEQREMAAVIVHKIETFIQTSNAEAS